MAEGMSIRAICRTTGASKNTITKLLVDAGTAFAEYQDKALRNLELQAVQVRRNLVLRRNEGTNGKEKNLAGFGVGDAWTWTAIDADTKLVPCWFVGTRDGGAAYEFSETLRGGLPPECSSPPTATTRTSTPSDHFGVGVDYAMLVKLYGTQRKTSALQSGRLPGL